MHIIGATKLVGDYGSTVKGVAKGELCDVTAATATNRNAATRYFQLHNLATAPAGGEAPYRVWPVPAGSVVALDAADFNGGMRMSIGCSWAWSTTEGTYTAATASDHSTEIMGA